MTAAHHHRHFANVERVVAPSTKCGAIIVSHEDGDGVVFYWELVQWPQGGSVTLHVSSYLMRH